jgi:septum formation protein
VHPADVNEVSRGDPAEVALENARRKAMAVQDLHPDALVLGVDTLVTLDGVIYGKPEDEDAARRTLTALSGANHTVISGLVLSTRKERREAITRTRVMLRELPVTLIEWYLASDEWRGRAGGYAIQGRGSALVREIDGEYENVVGLPLASLLDLHPGLLGA